MQKKYKLILASQSPRRRELLQYSYIKFKVLTSDIEEISQKSKPCEVAMDIAFQKAMNVKTKFTLDDESIVIGSDTIVVVEDEILGKPRNELDAKKMLNKMSNKEHEVISGVSILFENGIYNFFDTTKVWMHEITEDQIDLYLKNADYLDKAGAYGIQADALAFIQRIEGSYANVVGLPINLVLQKLRDLVDTNANNTDWRDLFE